MRKQPSTGFESWAIVSEDRMIDYIGFGQRVRGEKTDDEIKAEAYQKRQEDRLDRLTGL